MMSAKAKVLLNKRDLFSLLQIGDKTLLTQLKRGNRPMSNKAIKYSKMFTFP